MHRAQPGESGGTPSYIDTRRAWKHVVIHYCRCQLFIFLLMSKESIVVVDVDVVVVAVVVVCCLLFVVC